MYIYRRVCFELMYIILLFYMSITKKKWYVSISTNIY